MDLVVLANHRVKIKESEKIEKYLDFTRKLNNQKNVKVTVIPMVVGALGTVLKHLEKN